MDRPVNNIAIIDDHKLFSSGLRLLLSDLNGSYEISIFANLAEFLQEQASSYALIVLDFYVPGSNFSETMAKLQTENFSCPVVVISASPSPADRAEALAAGAKLFINKNLEPEKMIKIISELLNGDTPEVSCLENTNIIHAFKDFSLTSRQVEILILVAKGYSNKEVAQTYKISPETVKSHLRTIFRGINVQNRMEAVELVRHYGAI